MARSLPFVWAVALLALSVSRASAFPLGFLSFPTHARALRHSPRVRLSVRTANKNNSSHDNDHGYFRPPVDDVSGFPNNTKPYHRSPCPCMNSLANRGYLPRDGKNLTPAMMKKVVMEVFHIGESGADALVDGLPPVLTLADLSVHNLVEHDASMVREDAYFGYDPSLVNHTLVDQLLARATDGRLTKKVVAQWRGDREAQCAKTNPNYEFGFQLQAIAYLEAAVFLMAMGDYDSESISVADAASFLRDERFPDGFKRPKVEITMAHALAVAAKINVLSKVPWPLLSA